MQNLTVGKTLQVKSEVIKSIVFTNKTLIVKLRSGGVYAYLNVPQKTIDRFNYAESKGRFFSREIRNQFDYVKV